MDEQPADAAGRHPVRPRLTNYPDSDIGGPGYTACAAEEIFYPARSTQGVNWDDVTPRMGVAYDLFGNGKTALKFNLGQVHGSHSRRPIPTSISTRSFARPSARRGRGPTRTRISCRTATSSNPAQERRMRGHGQPELREGGVQPELRPRLRHGLGHPPVQLGTGRLGPAGNPAPRLGERRLLPQLVGQLVRGGQPGDRRCGLHAVQHHGAGRCAAAGRRRPARSAACTI